MLSSNTNLPIFSEAEKFDGTNFSTFETLIAITASSHGALGYLHGTIPNPAPYLSPTMPNIPLPDNPTPWYSTTPSGPEWAMCDAWACKNAVRLGLKLNSTAADAWKSLTSQYKVSSNLTMVTAQCNLHNTTFSNGSDFPTHISNLHTKWVIANNTGVKIDDADFHMIVLSSLPTSWDSVVGMLYEVKSSADIISRLMICSKSVANPATTVTVLQTVKKLCNQLQCTNQNCGCHGQTIANCYWHGGGKEGQFPPGFGQHGGACSSTPQSTTSTTNALSVTATLTDATPTSEITLGLISDMGSHDYLLTENAEVVSTVGNNVIEVHTLGEVLLASRDCILASYPHGAWGVTHALATMMASGEQNVPMYMDSAENKHCFINPTDFSTYHALSQPDEGQSASKGGQFCIIRHGAVTKTIVSGSLKTTITFKHTIHMPDLIVNLVSISRLNEANCWALFSGGGVTFYDIHNSQKRTLMTGAGSNGMYLLNVEPQTHALATHSLMKSTNLEVWHQCFGHTGVCSIMDMVKKGLVDGLDVVGGFELKGKCKDCIYGKQMAQPYNKVVEPETEVLECVYGDLWGPARVHSVGGAEYMMVFNDGGSSYQAGYFLALKASEAMLSAFTKYHVKSE